MGKPLVTPIHLLHNSHSRRMSRVTTGRNLFVEGGDGRSAQISIIRRASAMECELEAMEGRMSAGEPIDTDVYGRLAGRLCRLFELIGIRRLARPIDPYHDLAKALEAYPARAL
jgi:hypothetical protein